MRSYKFFSFLLAVCFLLLSFAGCSAGKPAATTAATEPAATTAQTTAATTAAPPEENAYYSLLDNQEYIKQIGRTTFYYGALAADWSASGIEFEYQGYGDLSVELEKQGQEGPISLLAVVDGENYTIRLGENDKGVKTYPVASDLPDGVHHVLIRRKTAVENQAQGRLLLFRQIQMTGRFLPRPADNKYKVAFIGDSITCGVGLKDYNGLLTYAVDLSTREGFDYDICSISGIGVYRSTSKHGGKANTMTKYYPYYNYYRDTTIRYNPTRKADLVIVNLNTNDQNTGSSSDETGYKKTLKTLLSEIREIHGENVNILWIVGMMVSKDCRTNQWLNSVFDELGGESAGLYRLTVDTNTSGIDGHPDQATHDKVSSALSAFIREKNLLDLSASQGDE